MYKGRFLSRIAILRGGGGGGGKECVMGKTQKPGGSGGMPSREIWTLGLSEINSDAI